MAPKSKPLPKGQRSLASFMFKPSDPAKQAALEDAPGPSTTPSGPSKPQEAPVSAPPPAKRARSAAPAPASAPAPKPRTTTPPNAEERHRRWQAKLLGDEAAGMARVRTQEGVAASGKPTPLEAQVAALQAAHPDCVLAIEVGYKYKFFGRDAEIASAALGIFSYPDRAYLVATVPAVTVDRHLRRLVQKGHKVGLVRQTESAAIKAAGDNRNKPFERRLVATYTQATLEAGELAAGRPAGGGGGGEGGGGVYESEGRSAFLVCVVEAAAAGPRAPAEIGVVAVETSTGEVFYSQFRDSPMRPELEARLMFAAPAELVVAGPLSPPTARLLEAYGGGARGVVRTETVDGGAYATGGALAAVTDFYGDGGGGGEQVESSADLDAVVALPPLVVRALAHALDHLRPFGLAAVLRQGAAFRDFSEAQELALSPNALAQLEILRNSDDGRERGSLLWLMDRTLTPAGARLVRRWVTRPLRDAAAIERRLDAVEELLERGAEDPVLAALPGVLKGLPDLERILGRVLHGNSSPPEFLTLLQTFVDLHMRLGMPAELEDGGGEPPAARAPQGVRSALLAAELAAAADLRCAAAARDTLGSLDAGAAAAGDRLRLFADDARFSEVAERRAAVAAAEAALHDLMPSLAKAIDARSVKFVSVANQGDYLVEVPVELEKRAPKAWERVSTTKKVARFRPPQVKAGLAALELARERLAAAAAAAWTRLQAEFSAAHYPACRTAVRALAALDCLRGFAALASDGGYCRPTLAGPAEPPQLLVEAGRHPVLDVLLEGRFVHNDIRLGGGGPGAERCAVITGPNMGGKSVYIRQAALIACMAQAGSFVPAKSARLHPFDAVFSRMGAADNLALGRSTFLEELGEASAILAAATPRSLVILDELGRGTATGDGRAIAEATLEYVAATLGALTLFVTHYPEVAAAGEAMEGVGTYYMAHVVEGGEGGEGAGGGGGGGADGGSFADVAPAAVPRVTFLYKATRGVAEASYGLNVARMAGLPAGVVARAAEKAAEMAAGGGGGGGGDSGKDAGLEGVAREIAAELRALAAAGAVAGPAAVAALQERTRRALG